VDYLGTRPFVDREKIGVIGICGSGGFALSAAQIDPRIKAVATSVMYDISMAAKLAPKEEQKIQLKEIAEQRYIDFEAGHPAMAPKAQLGSVDAMDPVTREFAEFYQASRGYHHNSTTQFSLTSNPAFMNFSLLDHLEDISPRPILLIVGENAHSRFFSDAVYKKAQEPKEMYVVPGANHVDLYDKTDLIPFDKLDEFFTDNLK